MDPLTGGLIAGSIATSAGQSVAAGIGNKKRIEAAERAATVANQRNIENWNRQNQYNDPSAAMARLKAAGLNPNMVYGTGSATGGTAGSVGGASAPVPNIQDIPVNMPNALGILSQHQNIQKAEAQTALTWGQLGVQALTIQSKELSIEQQKLYNEILEVTGMEIAKADLKGKTTGIAKDEKSIELMEQQKANAQKMIEKMDQEIARSKQDVKSQQVANALTSVKTKIEQKYLTRWEVTGVDPKSDQFFRIMAEVFMRAVEGNTTNGKNPPVTMKQVNEMFPGQIKDLSKEQLQILNELINAQYKN